MISAVDNNDHVKISNTFLVISIMHNTYMTYKDLWVRLNTT